jgi:hypothetical protein
MGMGEEVFKNEEDFFGASCTQGSGHQEALRLARRKRFLSPEEQA